MTRESISRPTSSTLYRGGCVLRPAGPPATALLIAGDTITWVGTEEGAAGQADSADQVVNLDGALVTPTFVDAHVHTSATGLALRGVDLSHVQTLGDGLALIEAAARKRQGRPVYAHSWDEDSWDGSQGHERRPPTARELDRASYGGVVYAPRVDVHSAVISSALAAASGARKLPGWNDSGLVTREAHHAARNAFYDGISAADRRADIDAALAAAAAAGIGLVHEIGGPVLSSEADFADVLAAGRRGDGPQVIGYWAELVNDPETARSIASRLDARGLAGDLNIDGSIGSRTALLRAPYADGPNSPGPASCGNAYLTVEQVRDHVAACSLAGIQAGFHVIGDAGADTVVAGFSAAARQIGAAKVVAARHRVEHLEMVDAAGITALVALGVTASVQPAFDAAWGGPDGMYAARLGRKRASGMNPFAALIAAGLPLAFGSDGPVTPFAPWAAIRAAVNHHDPDQRIPAHAAFLAHTRGGWRAAGIDNRGHLDPGQPASFAIWSLGTENRSGTTTFDTARSGTPDSSGLPSLSPGAGNPVNLRTVIRGRTVFSREGALS